MRSFWKKNCKNCLSVRVPPAAGGRAPRPPRCYSCLLLWLWWVTF